MPNNTWHRELENKVGIVSSIVSNVVVLCSASTVSIFVIVINNSIEKKNYKGTKRKCNEKVTTTYLQSVHPWILTHVTDILDFNIIIMLPTVNILNTTKTPESTNN